MDNYNTTSTLESEIEEVSTLDTTVENSHPGDTETSQKLIPRNPSKMVAEATKDMFLGGEMCE